MARETKEAEPRDEDIEDLARSVAARLAEARKAKGWTQKQFGEEAGMSQQRIYELEQGVGNVSVRTLAKMAKILDVDVHTLFVNAGPSTDYRLASALDKLTKILERRGVQDMERREQEEMFRATFVSLLRRMEELAIRKSSGED